MGRYVFVNLVPGSYTLACELEGFKSFAYTSVRLPVAGSVTINVQLEAGDPKSRTVISSTPSSIDLTTGQIGDVVQGLQLTNLPLNVRNPMMLYYLQAGTSPYDALGSSQQAVGSVDGLRTSANNVKIEGVWASDPSFDMSPAAPNAAVPMEAVEEYRLITSSAGPDAGRGAGAQVSVVYKSGTNRFHGSVYEFNRNTVFNANDFFGNRQKMERPAFLRNQYGASVGGPIIKNRTFFFATWEGQRELEGVVTNRYSYTATMRTGIFRYYKGGKNSGTLVNSKGNPVIPASSISTINVLTKDSTRKGMDSSGKVSAILAKMPLSNNYDLGDGFNLGGYRYVSNEPNNYNQSVVKIDHAISPKHQLNVALGGLGRDQLSGMMYSGYYNYGFEENKKNVMVGVVSALGSNLTNELHVGATRRLTSQTPQNPENEDLTGLFQMYGVANPGGRGAAPDGNLVAVLGSQRDSVNAYVASDNLTWIKRNHTIKAGFEFAHTTKNSSSAGDDNISVIYTDNGSNPANFTATGIYSADLSRAMQFTNDLTAMIGHISQTFNANSPEKGYIPYDTRDRSLRQREYGAFVSDT